jgi:hypothetical protein
MSALFQPGRILATPAALRAMQEAVAQPRDYLQRHLSGNWGVVNNEGRHANDRAVREGKRILSVYRLNDGTKIWITTEADRSATIILLPSEWGAER